MKWMKMYPLKFIISSTKLILTHTHTIFINTPPPLYPLLFPSPSSPSSPPVPSFFCCCDTTVPFLLIIIACYSEDKMSLFVDARLSPSLLHSHRRAKWTKWWNIKRGNMKIITRHLPLYFFSFLLLYYLVIVNNKLSVQTIQNRALAAFFSQPAGYPSCFFFSAEGIGVSWQ